MFSEVYYFFFFNFQSILIDIIKFQMKIKVKGFENKLGLINSRVILYVSNFNM